jgi:hypothetical protein
LKIGPPDARALGLVPQGDSAANGQRWLADLEQSWLQRWQDTQSAAAAPSQLCGAAASEPAADLSSTPPDASPQANAAPRVAVAAVVTAGLWTGRAALPVPLSGQPYAAAAALPVPAQGAATPAPLASTFASAPEAPLAGRRAAQVPVPEPSPAERVAFHVALTESAAQVSLRDASLTPPAALQTGQAIARQLGALGLNVGRVYVNGQEVRLSPGAAEAAPASRPGQPAPPIPLRFQEK